MHGAFSVKVQAPTRREIIGPAHMSQHTRTQPLTVSWNGATNKGDLLLDILDDANTGSGSYVRCRVEDTGSFTVPASYIANFDTTGPSTIVLIEHHSTSFTAKGIAEGSATATLLTQSQLLLRP